MSEVLIKEFRIPKEELSDDNLLPIEMGRLGRFVALTGKNGAGKSRILNKLYQYIHLRNGAASQISDINESLNNLKSEIKNNPEHLNIPTWETKISNLEKQLIYATERIVTSNQNHQLLAIMFVPKQLNLQDPRNLSRAALQAAPQEAKKLGFDGFDRKCYSYIQSIQDQYWEATHQHTTLTQLSQDEISESYQRLLRLVSSLLRTTIGRDINGNATLFDKPLAESNLSDGQTILIQFIVGMHAQDAHLENTVFLMDEPENHLHPAALIEFLDTLLKNAKGAQFFFATHSIPLLSYVSSKEPMSIWYVEEGKCSNAGRHPERVLQGLLGNDEQISYLHTFTSLPAQFAAINYAVESLFPPQTTPLHKDDPQISQIKKMITTEESTECLTLLDFGAGKGRLLAGLRDALESEGKSLLGKIDYFAFDTFSEDKELCKSVISDVYKNNSTRYFQSREEFFSSKEDACVDVVVMCNVLHEIPPNDWISIFTNESLIYRSLKNDGYLLIVEDQRIPTGEKAHNFGFLVMDTPHLRTFFSVTDTDCSNQLFITNDYKEDGRLKAHFISKILLERVSNKSRENAIKQLKVTSLDKIRDLRSKPANYLTGQAHGFWTQQFANASLFLEQNL